jgi:peptidyl-prolyl cis-trans isomerase SurA
MKKLLTAVGATLVILGASWASLSAQSTIIQRVLVKVNGEIFTQKDLEQRQIGVLRDKGNDKPTPKEIEEITPDLLVNAVDEMLIVQHGRELGYHMSDDTFKNYVEGIKTENKLNDADFKVALSQEGLTLDTFRETSEKQYIIRTVQQREIMGHMSLTEEEARQYYDKHPDEFLKPATVMLREILISVPAETAGAQQAFRPPNTDESAKQKMTAVRERAIAGEDFAKLVNEASDSASKTNGGVIGPVNVEEMSTGIRDLVDKLKVGEVSQPVRTGRGYQIFKLESRTAAEHEQFQNVRDQITQKVGEERLDSLTKKYLETLRSQALIEWKRDDLKQMYEKKIVAK